MDIIAGTPEQLPSELLSDMARYRYEVFVEKLGWKLPTRGRLELDQFDRPDTCYLIARDAAGAIVGTARLLPTQRPYLLASVFPELLGGAPAPNSPRVWELSRFAAVDFGAAGRESSGADVPSTALALLARAMRVVARQRARQLVSVSPVGIERILRRAGLMPRRIAPPLRIDDQYLMACLIDVDARWCPPGGPICAPAAAAQVRPRRSPLSAAARFKEGPAAPRAPRSRSCCWPAVSPSRS
jgi:N-acyl-L-homoserine lactone synthetase